MGIVIVVVCVGAGLNLALWASFYMRLDSLPRRIWGMLTKDRTEGDSHALMLLEERAAVKVGTIVASLREHEAHVAEGYRAQVAEAQVRARIAERQSSDAGVALSAASALVRELRALRDDTLVSPPAALAATEGRSTVVIEPRAVDTAGRPDRPEPTSRERPSPRSRLVPVPSSEGERLSEDEMTQIAKRPDRAALDANKTLVSASEQRGAP
jgi:hypothetical protein